MTDLRSIQRKDFVPRALNHQIGCLNAHLSWSPISTVWTVKKQGLRGDKPAATPGVLFLATPLPSPLPRSQIRLFLVDRKRILGEWSLVPGALDSRVTHQSVANRGREGIESNGGTYCGFLFSIANSLGPTQLSGCLYLHLDVNIHKIYCDRQEDFPKNAEMQLMRLTMKGLDGARYHFGVIFPFLLLFFFFFFGGGHFLIRLVEYHCSKFCFRCSFVEETAPL